MRPPLLLLVLSLTFFFLRTFSKSSEDWGLAKLPPRGWNSYDSFSWVVDEAAFLYNAEVVAQRLLPYGYEYVVVDFLWYRKNVDGAYVDSYGYDSIDEWGRPFPDPERWPSSKGGKGFSKVAQRVHDMGLKFGIHLMRGISTQAVNANTPILDVHTGRAYKEAGRHWRANEIGLKHRTCAWMQHGFMSVDTDLGAGRAFLRSLYQQLAEWGVDFVKLDCVFGDDIDTKEIITVSELLEEIDRPVVFSLSPGTSVTPSMAKGISSYVNMYRITADDWDTWPDVTTHFNISRDFAAAKKIGAKGLRGRSWPDLDMLPLGWLTDPGVRQGPHRKCNLTLDEQRTQMTLWSMAKSPLMFGGDLRHIDQATFRLITNPTLLEINSYSDNNKEFPYVFSTENQRREIHSLQKMENQANSYTREETVLGLVSCNDEKAKGWFVASHDGNSDYMCWNHDVRRSDSLPYCVAKKKPLLSSYEDTTRIWQYQEKFQLVANETTDACFHGSVNKKHTASAERSTLVSDCWWHANQVWRLNDNGTLENSYSSLCATMRSKKGSFITTGIRSWIATGRRGEIYLSFFNLNPVSTVISARISDLRKVLDSSFFRRGSCSGKEVWSGESHSLVKTKLSVTVKKHAAVLFVLNC
ncbi:Alpha-galactosidase [Ananas comosus]|uniref:Alpha-galactosidase n=1 Tax=Ananas comosus TaxID=4615 RepID=A0A199VCB9_ANACO|nr:Alpha-galactosidase [Ananas comosus]